MTDIQLRELSVSDVDERYVAWLNDPEVVKFTEQRWISHTLETTRRYVEQIARSDSDILFGIVAEGRHVGNIKLGPINRTHGLGETSYLIGDRAFWGRGIASRAIGRVVEIGFGDFGLEKITAGTYAPNIASERALLRNGFALEGVRKAHFVFEGLRVDAKLFGRLRNP